MTLKRMKSERAPAVLNPLLQKREVPPRFRRLCGLPPSLSPITPFLSPYLSLFNFFCNNLTVIALQVPRKIQNNIFIHLESKTNIGPRLNCMRRSSTQHVVLGGCHRRTRFVDNDDIHVDSTLTTTSRSTTTSSFSPPPL